MTAVIHGPRLYLVPTMPEDMDDRFVAMYANDGGENRYFRRSGRDFTKDELVGWCRDGLAQGNVFYYTIRLNEDDSLVGSIRIGPIDFENSISDIVTLIGDTGHRGKGLGREAIKLGIEVAFSIHNIRKLHGGVLSPNVGSLIAYTRAGFVEEGRLRDHYLINGEPVDWIIVSCFKPDWAEGLKPPGLMRGDGMSRSPMEVIDEIERVRARNNRNWMDLLRLAYRHAPEESAAIVAEVYREDAAISELARELTGKGES